MGMSCFVFGATVEAGAEETLASGVGATCSVFLFSVSLDAVADGSVLLLLLLLLLLLAANRALRLIAADFGAAEDDAEALLGWLPDESALTTLVFFRRVGRLCLGAAATGGAASFALPSRFRT